MDSAELIKFAKENGLHPIPVQLSDDGNESVSVAKFQGTLQEFWEAAKALGSKAVFIESLKMAETDFEREDDSSESDDDVISLLKLSPDLSKFKSYVGKECTFVLVAKGGAAEIELMLTENWWDEFMQKADAVYDKWADGQNDKSEEEEAAREEADEKALKSLRGLISDGEFCRLRTLRAMLEYATERFPELAEVDEFVIKPELQTLKAKIEAKGLHRKARRS